MALEWKEEYNTGEPEVDKQHQILFKYLADLEIHMDKFEKIEKFYDIQLQELERE